MSLNQNLSRNLKAIHISKKLSIADFADELNIARSSLQKILDGDCNLRMDTISLIASRLHTDELVLLQDQYTPNQLSLAFLMLDSIDSYRKMPEGDRIKAAKLFNELLTLLDTST